MTGQTAASDLPGDAGIESLVFRFGPDMAPEVIRARTPGARFIARARVVDGTLRRPDGSASPSIGEGLWGILLIQPEAPDRAISCDVVTDDGRRTHATVLTAPEEMLDVRGLVRQARYWELAPDWIDALDSAIAAGVADDGPDDGGGPGAVVDAGSSRERATTG